jgi:hypothetical protein
MASDRLGGRRVETPAKLLKRLVFHARLIRNPVHFPALAPIIGEGLFEVSRIWGDVRPNISNQDRSALHVILAEKFPASILEFADMGGPASEPTLLPAQYRFHW